MIFLSCNRYGSCFNAVTHIYNVFPGIIKHLPSWTKYLEVKKYWLATSICLHSIWVFSNTFLFPKILSLKSFVFFVEFLQLYSHLLKKFIFVWESADLVMSWHAPCLPKWGREKTLSFFTRPPSSLNLKTVHPPTTTYF